LATSYDADALAGFACSSGAPFEDEVERYVREQASRDAEHARRTGGPYRLLVFETGEAELVAVGAHTAVSLRLPGAHRESVPLVKLVVVALARSWQGRRLAGGERLSDAVLTAMIAHARRTHGRDVVAGIVARRNYPSLSLCRRNGLTTQFEYGPDYVTLVGRFVEP
jgi:hypothetical protein